MLDLVATAQTGDEAGLDRIAAALVRPSAHESLLAASRRFAGALSRLGLQLPPRAGPSGRPASARLH